MTDYWLTFRIDADSFMIRSSYDRRRALIEVIKRHSNYFWDAPTSFIAFKSGATIEKIAQDCKDVISVGHDIVLIGKVDYKSAIAIGNVKDRAILEHVMGYVEYI